jgi:hypothetical protein
MCRCFGGDTLGLFSGPLRPPRFAFPKQIFPFFSTPFGNTMAPTEDSQTVEVNKEDLRRAGDLVCLILL